MSPLGLIIWYVCAQFSSVVLATKLVSFSCFGSQDLYICISWGSCKIQQVVEGCVDFSYSTFTNLAACVPVKSTDQKYYEIGDSQFCNPTTKDCLLDLVIYAGFPPDSKTPLTKPKCTLSIQFSTAQTLLLFYEDERDRFCLFDSHKKRGLLLHLSTFIKLRPFC